MPRTRKSEPPHFNDPFATSLRILLKKTGTTQQQLADAIGMRNRQSIGNYCSGLATPDVRALAKIADYFGVSPSVLRGTKDNVEEPQANVLESKTGDEIRAKVGERIAVLRESRGLSQKGLSDELAKNGLVVRRETITQWENGTRDLKTEYLAKLSQFFNVTTDYLLGLSNVKSTDYNYRAICKTTRLSESAVAALLNASDEEVAAISEMICTGNYALAEKIYRAVKEWEESSDA